MKEIKIKSVEVQNFKAPLDMIPSINYKIGSYLKIVFEIREYIGYRLQTEHTGVFHYKMQKNPNRPICHMTYDEMEDMAYKVIEKELSKKYE